MNLDPVHRSQVVIFILGAISTVPLFLFLVIAWLEISTAIDFTNDGILYRFQTLIASILALVAASVTIFFLNRQIKMTKEIETTRRKNRLESVRATLLLKLFDIRDYTESCFIFLVCVLLSYDDEKVTKSFELPPLPKEISQDFEKLAEFLGDKGATAVNIFVLNMTLTSRSLDEVDRLQRYKTESIDEVIPTIHDAIRATATLRAHGYNWIAFCSGEDEMPAVRPTKFEVDEVLRRHPIFKDPDFEWITHHVISSTDR